MNRRLAGIILVVPVFLVFVFLVWGPLIANLLLSFSDWDILTPINFIGLSNYTKLVGFHSENGKLIANDPMFWIYLKNTLFFLMEAVVIFLLVMLVVKLTGNTSLKTQSRMRLLFLIPAAAAFPVIYALIWRWLFNPDFGLINCFIVRFGEFFHIPLKGPDWFSNKVWAKPAMCIYHICAYSGFWVCLGLIIFTGTWFNRKRSCLRRPSQSQALYDQNLQFGLMASQNRCERSLSVLFRFSLLMLAGFIFLPYVTDMSSAYVMTGGGPAGATTTLGYYTYNNAYQWFKMGYAAALTSFQVILPVLLGLLAWRMVNKYKICCILEANPKGKKALGSEGSSKLGGQTKNSAEEDVPGAGFGTGILLAFLAAIILLPWLISLLWGLSTSFKPPGEVFTYPPVWISKNLTISNYPQAWISVPYARFFLNTVYISTGTVLIQIVVIFLGAYSLSVLKLFGDKVSNLMFFLMVITMFVDLSACTFNISSFIALKFMGWIDTYKALIIPRIAWPMGFFLMKIYLDGLAPEIAQKRAEGCSEGQIFRGIVLPRGLPWAGMLAVVTLFQNWRAFRWPLVVINSMERKVLSVGTSSFQGLYTTDWSLLMAGAMLVLAVTAAIFLPLFILCERKVWRRIKLVVLEQK